MNANDFPLFGYLAALVFVAGAGVGILVWLAPVTAEEMTPALSTLHGAADWMLKGSIGAMLGFTGARAGRIRSDSDAI